MRVPNRFFGIRDLVYLKTGIRDFGGKGKRDSDFNYERDTGFSMFSGFTIRDSGNVVVKNRYPVTKSEKSFYFDNTSCPHFPQPVPLFLSHHLPLVHCGSEVCIILDNFLFYYSYTDVTLDMYFYQ